MGFKGAILCNSVVILAQHVNKKKIVFFSGFTECLSKIVFAMKYGNLKV